MNKDLLEISDGKLYGHNDMVKISCYDCAGCSSCCQDMGQSIWLDPYDVYQLTKKLGKTMDDLFAGEVELHVEDGLILPNLRMVGEGTPKCSFLNEEGRCSVHDVRPGYCRLFPLGRNYEDGKLSYFVLKDACMAPNKSKIKINKWLGVSNIKAYEQFVVEWHEFTKKLRGLYAAHSQEDGAIKAVNMTFLQLFYMTPYTTADFYREFDERMKMMNGFLQKLGIQI